MARNSNRGSPAPAGHVTRRLSSSCAAPRSVSGYATTRPAVLSVAKLLLVGIAQLPFLRAAPTRWSPSIVMEADAPMSPKQPTLWIYLAVAIGLVLLGGAFAGLTIALMGQVGDRELNSVFGANRDAG